MFAIRTFAVLGAVAGLLLGVPAYADDEGEGAGLKIEFKVKGITEKDAESYANWLERENDAIESAEVDGETVTVHAKEGEELELVSLYQMTRSYAEDAEKKDEVEFDAGSVTFSGRAILNLANAEDDVEDLAKKIDEMDEVKAWTEGWRLGTQIWIESEEGEEIELRKVLETLDVEAKLQAQFEDQDEEVEGLTLENVKWQPQLLD